MGFINCDWRGCFWPSIFSHLCEQRATGQQLIVVSNRFVASRSDQGVGCRVQAAIKVYSKRSNSWVQNERLVMRESKAMALLDHPHVLTLFETIETANRVHLVLERAEKDLEVEMQVVLHPYVHVACAVFVLFEWWCARG